MLFAPVFDFIGSPPFSRGRGDDGFAISEIPLIQPTGTSNTWVKWAEKHGQPAPPEPSIFTDSHGLAVDLARAGAGIAMTGSLIAAPCLASRALVVASPFGHDAEDNYYLVQSEPENEAASIFPDWLFEKAVATEMLMV